MHAQTASHLRHADEFFHELRLFPFEFGELVNNDKEVRDRLHGVAVFVQGGVAVDAVDAVLGENALTAAVLRLNGHHCALDLVAGEIRDGANHMREVVEQVRHTAALVVDDKKSNVFGTVVDGEGEDISLEGFGLAGAGRTGYEAVRAVVFFVNVEVAGDVSATEADQSAHRFRHVGFLPAGGGFEFRRTAYAVHIKEREGIRNFSLLFGVNDFDTPKAFRELRKAFGGHAVELDRRAADAPGARVVDALKLSVTLHDAFALVGQLLRLPGQQNR